MVKSLGVIPMPKNLGTNMWSWCMWYFAQLSMYMGNSCYYLLWFTFAWDVMVIHPFLLMSSLDYSIVCIHVSIYFDSLYAWHVMVIHPFLLELVSWFDYLIMFLNSRAVRDDLLKIVFLIFLTYRKTMPIKDKCQRNRMLANMFFHFFIKCPFDFSR